VCWRDPDLYLESLRPRHTDTHERAPKLHIRLAGGDAHELLLLPRGLPNGLRQDFDARLKQLRDGGTIEIVCDWPEVGIHSSTAALDWPGLTS
jgi:hypothetical protein